MINGKAKFTDDTVMMLAIKKALVEKTDLMALMPYVAE